MSGDHLAVPAVVGAWLRPGDDTNEAHKLGVNYLIYGEGGKEAREERGDFYGAHARRDLASSVLSVADWRRATVPRRIAEAQVEQLLKRDRHTVLGQRHYTIL